MIPFHIGDPVLITNGIDAEHRDLIGHSTTVTSELIGALPPTEAGLPRTLIGMHTVEETYGRNNDDECDHLALCYRPSDLMHLGGFTDEETTDEEVVFVTTRSI